MNKVSVLSFLTAVLSSASLGQRYVITQIAPFPDAEATYINDVNSRGQIVGHSTFRDDVSRGFLIDNGVLTEISLPDEDTLAFAINDSGTVVGFSTGESDVTRAFQWTANAGFQMLFPTRERSVAYDINNHGHIVGQLGYGRPYVMRDGVTTVLGTIYGISGRAVAINDDDVIVGSESPPWIEFPRGVRWIDDIPQQLAGGDGKFPRRINSNGLIVGMHWTYHIQTERPVYWSGNSLFYLPSLVGRGMGYGINESGDMVGWVLDRNWQQRTAALWKNLQLVLLQSEIATPGWDLGEASCISNSGQIYGRGTYNGTLTAFMLTPTDNRR
jgi:probable HAF family extracellular repeat protein